jgi:hypothetical protein
MSAQMGRHICASLFGSLDRSVSLVMPFMGRVSISFNELSSRPIILFHGEEAV